MNASERSRCSPAATIEHEVVPSTEGLRTARIACKHKRVARRTPTQRGFLLAVSVLAGCALGACDSASNGGELQSRASDGAVDSVDAGEPNGTRPSFCARERDDAVRDTFCAGAVPSIGGLRDLHALLGTDPASQSVDALQALDLYPNGAVNTVAVLGHSTALSGQRISPINPRTIILGDRVLMAYQRGVQQIELITRDRDSGAPNLYLFSFEQACNASDHGCSPSDLYTERVEADWARYAIHDDEELKNTPSDCRQCHQRGLEQPVLLMRELSSPWTHFFESAMDVYVGGDPRPGVVGRDLMDDFVAAHGDELYGGLAATMVSPNAPFILENVVGPAQPLLFEAAQIVEERYPYTSEGGYAEQAQPSPTWESGYEAFKRGEQLALPYLEQRVTDPDKQARLTEAYAAYRKGELDADALPDMADIFPDDPHVRARIGLQTEPDATPAEALIQACGSCHNDVLDQSISRARFNVDLSRLDRSELDIVIDRIELPRDATGAMPPPESRQLDPAARDRLLEYLRQDLTAADFDPQLKRAAELGMKGGANRP